MQRGRDAPHLDLGQAARRTATATLARVPTMAVVRPQERDKPANATRLHAVTQAAFKAYRVVANVRETAGRASLPIAALEQARGRLPPYWIADAPLVGGDTCRSARDRYPLFNIGLSPP